MHRLIPATPAKLPSGKWGAKAHAPDVEPGEVVRIEARNGKVWEAVVEKVVSRSDDSAIIITAKVTAPASEGCYACKASCSRQTPVDAHCDLCGARPVYV
jgi:hypothetical protein